MAFDAVKHVEQKYAKSRPPAFSVGDTVEVRVKILEGDKERIQPFVGTVIARKGGGIREAFTVRRIVQGEGVERTFPLHSPFVTAVRVQKHGSVRRSKLYYLRKRVGKGTRVAEMSAEDRNRLQTAAPQEDLLGGVDGPGVKKETPPEPAASAAVSSIK